MDQIDGRRFAHERVVGEGRGSWALAGTKVHVRDAAGAPGASSAFICPLGRRIAVPEGTIDDARP